MRRPSLRLRGKGRRSLAALAVLLATAVPASAQEQVKIGIGFGLAFLPTYICEDLKLIEKYARAAHLDVKANYLRYLGSGPMEEAIETDAIDIGPFGTAPLLAAWEQGKGTPKQIVAVSGLTTMPLALVSNQPKVEKFADLGPADRIAMPSVTAPQMFLLEMQSEKVFRQYDHLQNQVIALSPSASVNSLVARDGAVTASFLSPPYTQLALRDAQVHRVLNSADVNGKASFLVMGAKRSYVEAHPQIPDVIDKAIDEAARLIRDDPRRATQIYLTHEPSKALSAPAIEAILREIKDDFGSAVYGVQAFADFLGKHGDLKTPPGSWKDIVAPALLNSPST